MWKPGQLITVKGYVYITLCPHFFEVAFETTMVCRVSKAPTYNVGYHREMFPLLKSNNFLSLEHAYVKYWRWHPKAEYVPFEINIDHPLAHFVAGNIVNCGDGYLKPNVQNFSQYYVSLLNSNLITKCGNQVIW